MRPRLNLVVLRSHDLESAERFYGTLGLRFGRHRHGHGPEHLCAEDAGLVFEVYPSREGQPSTAGARLGFEVDDLDRVVASLVEAGGRLIRAPKSSPWGVRAVVADPDGHRVELTRASG
jgi:lactoylglutathione lyase